MELLTTAADQSPGSQKMEERRRKQVDKKLIWECYVGREARVSQLLSICWFVVRDIQQTEWL